MSDSLVPVAVSCPCPGTPHSDGDTVYLSPKLGLHGGALAQRKIIDAISNSAERDEIMASLSEAYCRYGVVAWSFVDADGKGLPVNQDTIGSTLLADFALGSPVADKADELYSEGLISPLRVAESKSSQSSSTNGSTSAPMPSSRKLRKR